MSNVNVIPLSITTPFGNSQQTQGLSTATTFIAFSWYQRGTKFLTEIQARISSVTGTLTNIECDLMLDSNGAPSNTSLESIQLTSGLPTGLSNVTFPFSGTTQLTDGSLYWVVLKNNTATPASNFPTYSWNTGGVSGAISSSVGAIGQGWFKALSTDGTTWAGYANGVSGFRIGYKDGTYDGIASDHGTVDSTNQIFGANEAGCQFVTPSNGVSLNVVGIQTVVRKVGAPTGNLAAKFYQGNPPAGAIQSTSFMPPASVPTSGAVGVFMFPNMLVAPSTIVTITLLDTATDSSANAYRLTGLVMNDTTRNSLNLLPWAGTSVEAWFNGSVWNTGITLIPYMTLLLDPATPFL